MKKLILMFSVLLCGCPSDETIGKKPSSISDNNALSAESGFKSIDTVLNVSDDFQTNNTRAIYLDEDDLKLLNASDTQNYNVQDSLNVILNTDDPREVVYLVHPNKPLLVYCYHDVKSECYIEGVNNHQFFKYDISQVEGQNKGKLTSPNNPIDSAKTIPMKWMNIEDDYVMVLMTSKIMLNSQQHTLHEPLAVDYEKGIMVR